VLNSPDPMTGRTVTTPAPPVPTPDRLHTIASGDNLFKLCRQY
jgi:hypothetical protein